MNKLILLIERDNEKENDKRHVLEFHRDEDYNKKNSNYDQT